MRGAEAGSRGAAPCAPPMAGRVAPGAEGRGSGRSGSFRERRGVNGPDRTGPGRVGSGLVWFGLVWLS